MTTITFIEHGGARHVVDATNGNSVMQAARDNNVPGILADCGGACACATCHVIVAPEWAERLPAISEVENGMLDLAFGREPSSRLSCQIKVEDSLEGLVVRLPQES